MGDILTPLKVVSFSAGVGFYACIDLYVINVIEMVILVLGNEAKVCLHQNT